MFKAANTRRHYRSLNLIQTQLQGKDIHKKDCLLYEYHTASRLVLRIRFASPIFCPSDQINFFHAFAYKRSETIVPRPSWIKQSSSVPSLSPIHRPWNQSGEQASSFPSFSSSTSAFSLCSCRPACYLQLIYMGRLDVHITVRLGHGAAQ